ncbi:hypothetical protein [Bifidobacterium felsineum]|nr:hypothetical protein [Bifidobacterium felsineum]MBT1163376.1 hypothetical protein [Bifidobacterium felsineum]
MRTTRRSAVIFILLVCGGILLLIRAAGSLWVSNHGDLPVWTPEALDLPALVCGIALILVSGLPLAIAVAFSRDQHSWQRLRQELKSDSFVGIAAEQIHPGLVAYADVRGNDDDISTYPVKYVIWQINSTPRTVHIPAYIDDTQWKALNGQPDPRPKWEQRHFMAMLDLDVVHEHIAVTGMTPIPVVFVERAWDRHQDDHTSVQGASMKAIKDTLLVDDDNHTAA